RISNYQRFSQRFKRNTLPSTFSTNEFNANLIPFTSILRNNQRSAGANNGDSAMRYFSSSSDFGNRQIDLPSVLSRLEEVAQHLPHPPSLVADYLDLLNLAIEHDETGVFVGYIWESIAR